MAMLARGKGQERVGKKTFVRQGRIVRPHGSGLCSSRGADAIYFRVGTESGGAGLEVSRASERECRVAEKTPARSGGSGLVKEKDIRVGPEDAEVTLIEYLDSNYPHCADFREQFKPVVESLKEKAQFVYKPFPLGQKSLLEIEALYIAEPEGKLKKMIEARYEKQKSGEISAEAIEKISEEIGMDGTSVLQEISTGQYAEKILVQEKAAAPLHFRRF